MRRALRDLAGKVIWALGPTRPERTGRDRLTVVTFHRVLPTALRSAYPYPGLAVTPEELGWFVAFFRRHYAVEPLAGALERWRAGKPTERPLLAITFDDGQVDNFEFALPVLEKGGVRATFFVPASHVEEQEPIWHDRLGYAARAAIDRRDSRFREILTSLHVDAEGGAQLVLDELASRLKALAPGERDDEIARIERIGGQPPHPAWDGMMSWEQLRALRDAGHEIGSHSLRHPILPRCGDVELEREVAGSKALLEERLQVEIPSFCYPNGDYDARVAAAVERAGYRQAVTTGGGPNRRGTPPFELGRCDMVSGHLARDDGGLSEATLAWRLSGFYPGAR